MDKFRMFPALIQCRLIVGIPHNVVSSESALVETFCRISLYLTDDAIAKLDVT